MSSASAPEGAAADPPRAWTQRVASALTHRNFRILWLAALGSTIGTWMQTYAQSVLVFNLTQSNFYLGVDTFLGQLPIILFMLIGGVVADRHDRRRLLTGSQYVQAIAATTLAVLVYTGASHIAFIFALSFIAGCGQAFGGPAYQAMIPQLVPRKDLANAIALNSTQFNLSRVLGPVAGGVVVTTIGLVWCFSLNALSFFLVVFALASLRLPAHVPPSRPRALRDELRSGLHYVRDTRLIYVLTVLVFLTTFLSMPIAIMLPAFANNVLTGAGTPEARLSILMASQGLGAILGALIVGSRGLAPQMGRAMLGSMILLGALIAAFSFSRVLPLSAVLLFAAGLCSMAVFSMSFSLVQHTVPDELRGRVVSIYMVSLRSGWPLGGLVAGGLADIFSAPAVLAVNGVALTLLGAALFLRGGSLRKI